MPNRFTKGLGLFQAIKIGTTTVTSALALILGYLLSAFTGASFQRGVKVGTKAIVGADLHAGVLAWQNPESTSIIIERVIFDITTQSTGASTVDVGTTAVSATTASDTLLDGFSGASAAVFDSLNDTENGTNGATKQKLATGKWVTFKEASGDVTGMVAKAYIHYVVVEA